MRLKKLNNLEIKIALQRKWHLVYPDKMIPDHLSELSKIIPAALTREKKIDWIRGSLEEAKYQWLRDFNQCYTKEQLDLRTKDSGVLLALQCFPMPTRKHLEEAIKTLV